MDEPITIVERAAQDMQRIATAIARPDRESKMTGNVSSAASVVAVTLPDLEGIVIPLAK
jgi:hypothetical protein